MSFVPAVLVPIAGLTLMPLLFGLSLLFGPDTPVEPARLAVRPLAGVGVLVTLDLLNPVWRRAVRHVPAS